MPNQAESRDDYTIGAYSALAEFRRDLIEDRGRIENERMPVFDVIIDLLDRCMEQVAEPS